MNEIRGSTVVMSMSPKAIGTSVFGLPGAFDMESTSKLMYILPIVSLALPSVAGLMKWMRRYMIDQMNSDYVKFARSSGLTEGEIFSKHIMKNASTDMMPMTKEYPILDMPRLMVSTLV